MNTETHYKTETLDLRLMDCIELMKEYPDKYFDLAIVDPPYGIGVNVNMGRRKGDKPSDYHKFAGEDIEPPSINYFNELFRVSKDQIVWGANHFIDRMPISSPCWLMWDKGFSEEVTFAQFELAWTSFKSTCKKFNKHPADPSRIHPTQKPVALYRWLIANYAKEGMKILDTHLGSMSHAIAAHYGGVHLTGCELDPDYFAAGIERVKNETSQLTLF
jgi:site-specific DNA-methyltransferase (adenine-specific)